MAQSAQHAAVRALASSEDDLAPSSPTVPDVFILEASPLVERKPMFTQQSPTTPRFEGGSTGGFVGLYNFKQTIGRGHFGIVRLAEHALTKEKVAVKIIDKTKLDQETRDQLYNEVRFMKLLKHPHIVSLYEVCETPTQLYLILELADGGDLYDKVASHGALSEEVSRECFRQILSAVLFCHSLHIAHRDIKPENVLLVGDVLKVSDFGMSSDFSPGGMLDASVGSLAYSAPEILLGDMYYGESVDVWSLGVTLYMLSVGQLPFDEANPSEMVVRIMEGDFSLPWGLSRSLQGLLCLMLTVDSNKRISLAGVADHPWVTDNGTDPLMSELEEEQLTPTELSTVVATLGALKIDYEQIKRDISNNVHNYNVATYHLLRLQKLRERREKRRPSSIAGLVAPDRGLPKSPSSEDAQGLKNFLLFGDQKMVTQRAMSADVMELMDIEMIGNLKRKDEPIVSSPSPAVSPYQWRFGARRRPREDSVGGVVSICQAHSMPTEEPPSNDSVAAEELSDLDRVLARLDSMTLTQSASTDALRGRSNRTSNLPPGLPQSNLAPQRGTRQAEADTTGVVHIPVSRMASAPASNTTKAHSPLGESHVVTIKEVPSVGSVPILTTENLDAGRSGSNRHINLISEESQEDDGNTNSLRVTGSQPKTSTATTTGNETGLALMPQQPMKAKSRSPSPRSVQRKMTKAKQNCVVS